MSALRLLLVRGMRPAANEQHLRVSVLRHAAPLHERAATVLLQRVVLPAANEQHLRVSVLRHAAPPCERAATAAGARDATSSERAAPPSERAATRSASA